jgi:hypothetical protein
MIEFWSNTQMELNRPDIVAEVTDKFLEYERAINSNDIDALDRAFFDSDCTVRFGMTEELWSFDEIRRFRRTPNTAGTPRKLERFSIVTFGDRFAVANAVFIRDGINKIGRQSQTWVKLKDGWKVIAAHVSLVDPR